MGWRARIGTGVGGLGIGLGTGAAGIGWLYSSVLLDPTERPIFPERVLAADRGSVLLAANRLTRQPGLWGLRWAAQDGRQCLAVVGPVLGEGRGGVVRELVDGPVPAPGTLAVLEKTWLAGTGGAPELS